MGEFILFANDYTNEHVNEFIEIPFNQGIINDDLSEEVFEAYILQDEIYLVEYRAMIREFVDRNRDDERIVEFFASHENDTSDESVMHESYEENWGFGDIDVEPNEVCVEYLNFLGYLLHERTDQEFIAGIMPCYMIYYAVGAEMALQIPENSRFESYVATYNLDREHIENKLNFFDEITSSASVTEQDVMREFFIQSVEYEYKFWSYF